MAGDEVKVSRQAPRDFLAGDYETSPSPDRPGEAFLRDDIDRSNDYRKEYYKYAIGIATALLAFTVSFQPQLAARPEGMWLAFVGWAGLGVAVLAGVRLHHVWSRFYISYRNHDNRGHKGEGQKVRAALTSRRHLLEGLLFFGLVFGMGGVVAFTAINS
jgi:hypothetical protein